MDVEPFAYGIEAPIGSVTPLFHKRKDAEDYIAKLTDSRDAAKIIPLYRAAPTVYTMLECWHRVIVQNDELTAEIARLQNELNEEARLNGAGSSREARLSAIVAEKDREIARLRLTDAERDALQKILRRLRESMCNDSSIEIVQMAAVIDGLLGIRRCPSEGLAY